MGELKDEDAEPELQRLFKASCASIVTACRELGHPYGWRFITGPRRTLSPATKIALITTNPAGHEVPPDHPHESQELGSAYLIESWNGQPPGTSILQVQIQELFRELQTVLGNKEPLHAFAAHRVLGAHLIPFRSPRLHELHRKTESIAFAHSLWGRIFAQWLPSLFIVIGNEAQRELAKVLTQTRQLKRGTPQALRQTGWGNTTFKLEQFISSDGSQPVVILGLPHLSTFKLFSRAPCAEPIRRVLNEAVALSGILQIKR